MIHNSFYCFRTWVHLEEVITGMSSRLVVIKGPLIQTKKTLDSVLLTDIAPTILYLSGIPQLMIWMAKSFLEAFNSFTSRKSSGPALVRFSGVTIGKIRKLIHSNFFLNINKVCYEIFDCFCLALVVCFFGCSKAIPISTG